MNDNLQAFLAVVVVTVALVAVTVTLMVLPAHGQGVPGVIDPLAPPPSQPHTLLPPEAPPVQGCEPTEDIFKRVHTVMSIRVSVTLDREQSDRVVAWYNKQPPEGREHFNLVIVLRHDNGRWGLMLGNDGKICEVYLIEAPLVPSFVDALIGHSI